MPLTLEVLPQSTAFNARKLLIPIIILAVSAHLFSVGWETFFKEAAAFCAFLVQPRPVQIMSLACIVAALYWLLIPRTWRMYVLLAVSFFLLWLLGASLVFMAIVLILTLMTFAAARPSTAASTSKPAYRRLLIKVTMVFILGALIVLKLSTSQPLALVGWIGFSYMAFRLMHVLIDAYNGRYADASVSEMLLYVFFFPSLLVGPIDRLPRFLQDRRSDPSAFEWIFVREGLMRILVGCAKKFFLADLLFSQIALNVEQVQFDSSALAWIQLYFYAFYLFFDFSGYVDIALGTALMLGYRLPENFRLPYLKPNITAFWQSWHITLTDWMRTYAFLPISRTLMQSRLKRRKLMIIFVAQAVTMLLVGLWHGITLNFALWGLWHACGLFAHKVFSDQTRAWQMRWKQQHTTLNRLTTAASILLTFHFVLFGWVFFALPTTEAALRFFSLLLGQAS